LTHHIPRRALLASLAAPLAAPALAQAPWPARPIRLLVGYSPGGGVDVTARRIAQKLSAQLGQPVVVDNKPGGTGAVAAAEAARAAADGYTLFAMDNSYATLPLRFSNLAFNHVAAFQPITVTAFAPLFLGVARNASYVDLSALIAAAKAQPEKIAYGTGGNGSVPHFATLAFERAAGVQLFHVPFRGANEAVLAVLSGTVQMTIISIGSALGSLQSGDLRPLAISGQQRVPALPNAPTFTEAGLPGYAVSAWFGLAAPQGTPDAIVDRLYQGVRTALADSDMRQFLDQLGAVPGGMPPAEFVSLIAEETALWRDIAAAGGIEKN
jgi:tripartite-type tricarboxylate transporter receptor subunit TctC